MPLIPLSIGVPAGVDLESGQLEVVLQDGTGQSAININIPGGEAWLVHSISSDFTTDGTVGGRIIYAKLFQGPEDIAAVSLPLAIPASTTISFSFILGGVESAPSSSADVEVITAGLPWLIGTMGMLWQVGNSGNVSGADHLVEDVSMVVTKFDYGGASGVPEVLGPFMYVPGPAVPAGANP